LLSVSLFVTKKLLKIIVDLGGNEMNYQGGWFADFYFWFSSFFGWLGRGEIC